MKKESKEKIVCIVMLGVIVMFSGWFGGLIDDKFDEERMQISNPISTVVAASEIVDPAEIENETVQVETNETSEIESVEIITAKDIGLEFVQLRYEKPFLYLTAITNMKDKSPIFMETIENNEIREINLGRVGIMPQSTGKIDIKFPITIQEDCRIRLNFYRQGEKIATVSSPPVTDGKAMFVPVLLTTENPSKWLIRIFSQSYGENKLVIQGETNIPNEEKIDIQINHIGQWRNSRTKNTFTTVNRNSGQINFEENIALCQGRYKITVSHQDRKFVLGMGVTRNGNKTEASDWIKNVYVPSAAV